jgi:hypothetical protein
LIANSFLYSELATYLGSVYLDPPLKSQDVSSSQSEQELTAQPHCYVFSADSFAPHNDLLHESPAEVPGNERKSVRDGLNSLGAEAPSSSQVYLPQGDSGEFSRVDLAVLPSGQISDLSNLDFGKPEDRAYSLSVVSKQPRLVVLNLFQEADSGDDLETLHSRWVSHIAMLQHNQGKGFIVVRENPTNQVWQGTHMSCLREMPGVEYLPVEWCQFGLLSSTSNETSGILTNVSKIVDVVKHSSDAAQKRKKPVVISQNHHCILHDVSRCLKHNGWLVSRDDGTCIESFMIEARHTGTSTNCEDIASGIWHWVIAEELCDIDLHGHNYLCEHFPLRSGTTKEAATSDSDQDTTVPVTGSDSEPSSLSTEGVSERLQEPWDGRIVNPPEFLDAPAVGEDLGDEVEACMEDDYQDPTEEQKREVFKLHRNLGHPVPNDFGRALRNAGMRRHLIRWAVKEL